MTTGPSITTEQEELLAKLVAAEQSSGRTGGRGDRFAWHTSGGLGDTILMHRGVRDHTTVDPRNLEALISAGYLERAGQRSASLTPAGIDRGLRTLEKRDHSVAIDVSWEAAERVLDAFWITWTEAGAPSRGVPLPAIAEAAVDDPSRVLRLLDLLEEEGWVRRSPPSLVAHHAGPFFVAAPRALRDCAGWPSAEGRALDLFLRALEQVSNEAAPEEKGRIKALRDDFVVL